MHVTSTTQLDDGTVERSFVLGDLPGVLWVPEQASTRPVPLVLAGHPGGLDRLLPRVRARAQRSAADGHATATIELPGSGERPRIEALDSARSDLRQALADGDPVESELVDRLILPLVEQAVPELQLALDALLALPEIAGPVGCSGGVAAIGVRLALLEPRVVALGLFAGSFVPANILADAREVTIPAHVLLQWDDEGNDRQMALDLFDALGSSEKTLQANLGGHTGVPAFAAEDAARFFARHLGAG